MTILTLNRRGTVFALTFALFAAMALSWAFASPLFSVPDENAHITKGIALVRGQWVAEYTQDGTAFVELPQDYSYVEELVCFVRDNSVSADCAPVMGTSDGRLTFPSWVANYNPLYYALVSWPTLFFGPNIGLYAMRCMSIVVSAFFVATALSAASATSRRTWLPLGLLFVAAPMTTYFVGAVNPQGLEITSALAAFATALALADRSGRSARWWVLHAVSAATLMNVRASGPLWYFLVLVVVVIVVGVRRVLDLLATRAGLVAAAFVAIAGVLAVLWLLKVGQLTQQAIPDSAPLIGASFGAAAVATLFLTPAYLEQALGVFGWLDTGLPPAVLALGGAVSLMPVFLVFLLGSRKQVGTMTCLLLLALAIPIGVQGWAAHNTGLIWQGRYGTFIYLIVGVAAAWILGQESTRERVSPPRVLALCASGLGAFAMFAFVWTLSRYSTGLDEPVAHTFTRPLWQAPGGNAWVVALYLGSLLGWAVLLLKLSTRKAADLDGIRNELEEDEHSEAAEPRP